MKGRPILSQVYQFISQYYKKSSFHPSFLPSLLFFVYFFIYSCPSFPFFPRWNHVNEVKPCKVFFFRLVELLKINILIFPLIFFFLLTYTHFSCLSELLESRDQLEFKETVWIGLNDIAEEGHYVWIDHIHNAIGERYDWCLSNNDIRSNFNLDLLLL